MLYKSGLDFAHRKSGMTLAKISKFLPQAKDGLGDWIAGQPVPEEHVHDLAIVLGVSPSVIRGENLSAEGKVIRPATKLAFYNRDPEIDGYWGNAGLRAPGCDKSRWVSISDATVDQIRNAMLEEDDCIAFCGMGLNGWVVFPSRMTTLRLVSEASDHIAGDWDITEDDPVEGHLPAVVSALTDHGFHAGDFEASPAFFDAVNGCLEGDVVTDDFYEIISTIEVHLVDGTTFTFHCLPGDKGMDSFISAARRGYIEDAYFNVSDGPDDTFIPMNNISMIRFPASFFHDVTVASAG